MAGGIWKLQKGAEDLGAADEDPGAGGGQPEGIRDVLQGSSAGGVAVMFEYVGTDPPHWTVHRKFSAQV